MRAAAAAGAANALGSRACNEVDHWFLGKQHTWGGRRSSMGSGGEISSVQLNKA